MKRVTINNQKFDIMKDYKNAYNQSEIEEKLTDYFDNYDYILGDWSYGKLRLKGFCDKKNKIFKEINDIKKVEDYIKDNCAYECSHFILQRVKVK